ncbi:hypothetical protein BSKO_04018 [Bryopsis sp. KO-2023]|nr:hypothetical protein BSKO_04018 [Bryopsis sp. KO-2023]
MSPPRRDRPFLLHTDWSKQGIAAILSQRDDDGHERFRHYLFGADFTVVTDHHGLQWMMTTQNLAGRVGRWAMVLMEYSGHMSVLYRKGKVHQNVDALSRARFLSADGYRGCVLPAATPTSELRGSLGAFYDAWFG